MYAGGFLCPTVQSLPPVTGLDPYRTPAAPPGAPAPGTWPGTQPLTLILRDIAARKQAKAQLRSFIDDAPAAIAMFDRSMRYLAASTRWIEDYGLDADAVLGRSHYDVLPDIPERWKDVHRRALRGETIKTAEDRFDRAGAASIWLHWEIRPWYSASGTIEGVILFTEDITERKHAEEAQRRAEVAYVELAEAHEHLHKTASDRTVLLRELSHRMRNDLAAVASLLSIQAKTLEDPAGKAALVAAGDRIQVLARVHQRLTIEDGAAVLDSKQFITDLCHDLR